VPNYAIAGDEEMLMHIKEAGMNYRLKLCEENREKNA
jgi:hypothetical protein